MTGVRLNGLRLWISSIIHWPMEHLQERLEVTERHFDEVRQQIQSDLERRVRQFERTAAAWAVAGLLLAIAGIFLLIGLWLWFAEMLGPVAASFLLAALFGGLAPIPLLVLHKLSGGRNARHARIDSNSAVP